MNFVSPPNQGIKSVLSLSGSRKNDKVRDYYFIDDGITRAGYYEYRIIARHYDGGFSQMSDIIYIESVYSVLVVR